MQDKLVILAHEAMNQLLQWFRIALINLRPGISEDAKHAQSPEIEKPTVLCLGGTIVAFSVLAYWRIGVLAFSVLGVFRPHESSGALWALRKGVLAFRERRFGVLQLGRFENGVFAFWQIT